MTCLVSLVAGLSVMLAGPASAAVNVTRAEVAAAMITGPDLGAGWKRTVVPDNDPSTDSAGCDGGSAPSAGLRFDVSRGYQYRNVALRVAENISTFATVEAARADMVKGIASLRGCSSVTIDGRVWKLARLTMPSIGDQRVRYRLVGSVLSPTAGAVPVLAFLVVTRHGRHEITSTMVAGGTLTASDRQVVTAAATRLGRLTTAKVAARLAR